MLSDSLLTFIGIALSILVIFIVTSRGQRIDSLYYMIMNEIHEKINDAISETVRRHDKFNDKHRSLSNEVNIILPQLENGKNVDDNNHKLPLISPEALKKQQVLIEKNRRVYDLDRRKINAWNNEFHNLFANSKSSQSLPAIVFQAPFYTALYCLLVVGMHVFLNDYYDQEGDHIDLSLFFFTLFSILFWLFLWLHRLFYAGFPQPRSHKTEVKKKRMNADKREKWIDRTYRPVFSYLTQYMAFPILAVVFLLWVILFSILHWCHFSTVLNGILICSLFLFCGFACFISKKDSKGDFPFLNFYGQIIVILCFSVITQSFLNAFGVSAFTEEMVNVKVLRIMIFHFIFINGFVLPIFIPLLYYHSIVLGLVFPLRLAIIRYYSRIRGLRWTLRYDAFPEKMIQMTRFGWCVCYMIPLLFAGSIAIALIIMAIRTGDREALIQVPFYLIAAVLLFFVCRSGFSGRLSKRIVPYLQPSDVHQSDNKTSLGGEDVAEEGVEVDGTVGLGGVAQDGDDQLS